MYTISNDTYTAPEIEILDIAVEQGFSSSIEDPETNPDLDW